METEEKLKINIEKLQNQVRKEILADEKYMRENDAKLRAVEQRVPTYEDFRQMVLGSHLKPLDKGESLRDRMASSKVWNSVVNSDSDSSTKDQLQTPKIERDLINSVPRTNLEFIKIWKELEENVEYNEQDKWMFLRNLGRDKLEQLFRVEISGDLLGKFICLFKVIIGQQETESIEYIVELLKLFPKCNRFSLSIMFLKKDQLDACKSVFERLEELKFDVNDFKKFYF